MEAKVENYCAIPEFRWYIRSKLRLTEMTGLKFTSFIYRFFFQKLKRTTIYLNFDVHSGVFDFPGEKSATKHFRPKRASLGLFDNVTMFL